MSYRFKNIKDYLGAKARTIYCPVCNAELLIDDIDFNFSGCYDIYSMCPNEGCTSCVIEVRYNKVKKETFYNATGEIIKRIKYNISSLDGGEFS